VSLTTEVSGVLPIANGGTNNSVAYTAGSVIFSDGTKLTQNNLNLNWDNTNNVLTSGVAKLIAFSNNTYLGNTGASLTTGSRNSGFGSGAGNAISTGTDNTLVGSRAGELIATSSSNSIFGSAAGILITTGNANTLIGSGAGQSLSTGQQNAALGDSSLLSVTTGSNNVAIGSSAFLNGNHSSSIAIGFNSDVTANNQLVIGGDDGSGNGKITDAYFGQSVTNDNNSGIVPAGITFHATGAVGTNIAGGAFTLAGGKATGNASGGSIIFQTSDAGASGTTLQSLTTKMTLLASGNVGIGDTSPAALLTVGSGDLFQINSSGAIAAAVGITNTGAITSTGGVISLNASSNFAVNVGTGSTTSTVTIGGGSAPLVIDSTNFDVTSAGVISGATGFTSSGTITFSSLTTCAGSTNGGALTTNASGVVSCSADDGILSSIQYKHDIIDLDVGLAELNKFRPVSFRYNSTDKLHLGFVAEEVLQFDPRLVSYEQDGTTIHGLYYIDIIPIIVKALQDEDIKVSAMDLRLKGLETLDDGSGSGTSTLKNLIMVYLANTEEKIVNGVVRIQALVVDTLTIGSPTKQTAITVYDKNGQIGCMTVEDVITGETRIIPGECGTVTPPPSDPTPPPVEPPLPPSDPPPSDPPPSDPSPSDPPPPDSPPVSDTTPPAITLIGLSSITINQGDTYTDEGATATDDTDGDITTNIITVNPVDTATAGTYTITYNVSDIAGNPATEVTRSVVVEAPAPPPDPPPPTP
jgi:hypothetical protein